MSVIKRYDCVSLGVMLEREDGDYVSYVEHESALAQARSDEYGLRKMLFFAHISMGHGFYGDDGELQCSTCGIDFGRDSVDVIKKKLERRARSSLSGWPDSSVVGS